MRWFESTDELEGNEERLRKQVNALSDQQKKVFYQRQAKVLKDPDTYAALNWFFVGGFHHFYLGKYRLFALELTLLIISIVGLILGHSGALVIIALLILYELPQLFFAQKIARQYNYILSCQIYDEVTKHHG